MAGGLTGTPPLLAVDDALRRLLAGVRPLPAETIPLAGADDRVLAEPVKALRTQPPVAVAQMDGYAVRSADLAAGTPLAIIGSAPAGAPFAGTVGPGEAVRIFTGAPLPAGADAVALQENAVVAGGGVTLSGPVKPGQWVRAAGLDFRAGDALLPAERRAGPIEIALAAAGGHPMLSVHRRPRVVVIPTGDELRPPGAPLPMGTIVDAVSAAVVALARRAGADASAASIVGDDDALLAAAVEAGAASADAIVTIGGASVGDRDRIRPVLERLGFATDFWRVALRPGRPILSARRAGIRLLGLPGNPVSALVTARLFLDPLLRLMQGETPGDPSEPAILAVSVPANDLRQDYLRSRLEPQPDGLPRITPLARQDSSLLAVLAAADCLLIRPPQASAAAAGTPCRIIRLR